MITEEPEGTDNPAEDTDLFEHFNFKVDPGQQPFRVDKYLLHKIENATRTRIQYALEEGNVLVNGKPSKASYKVRPGDEISVVFPYPKREIELIAEDIPLNIVYEDDDLMVINKAPGMVVHPGHGNLTGTLMNALMHHVGKLPAPKRVSENDPFGQLRPGLLHRIDKNTSGLLVIAKNERAMTKLAKEFHEKKVLRKYIAIVWGDFQEEEGTVDVNIGRDHKDRKKMAAFPLGDHGRNAVTHYKVLERFQYVTLLECRLETGRTHQIRVHMQYLKHPIFNDEVYGGNRVLRGTVTTKYNQFVENCFAMVPRQALHAMSLGFTHPVTGKEMYFESPLPDDMKQVIEKWRKYTSS
jgi:23S rRNA pseudouridine1911/1915/1917 synthase